MKLTVAAYQLTFVLEILRDVVDLLVSTVRLVWNEGPQLADWIEIGAGLGPTIASAMAY